MNEMNFIPAAMARDQRNHRIVKQGSKLILIGGVLLLAMFLSLNTINRQLGDNIEKLKAIKNELNTLLQQRDTETLNLKNSRSIASSLDNLNSFAALSETLSMLNQSIPDETALNNFDTEINQIGESIVTLSGIADSHHNLTSWISTLKSMQGVKSADLLSSDAIQSSNDDDLKQRFSLRIVRRALETPAS